MLKENGNISIHTENIFPIIKKWLYSDKDIFIRELISNGCDAINKYKRLIQLGEAKGDENNFKVTLEIDKEAKTMKFIDNGIGMTAEEVKKYITQVAFSGAEDFIEKYKEQMEDKNDIIGHFGLGFYSAFMVSTKVEIDTLSYKGGAEAVKWSCEGGTDYEMTESKDRSAVGTTITLHIAEDSEEFLDEYKVKSIMKKYCSFLPVEIYFGEDKEPINDINPLWNKAPKDCTDDEYKEFYKKVFNEYEEPLFWIHLNVDYPFNLKGILYFPKLKNEFELVEGQVKLYNNQVFVADNIKEVIPEFLLLLKGVIDCPDLPLNVSRSFLQQDKEVAKISKHIVKKVGDKLNSLFKNDRDNYNKFSKDINIFIKFGCLKDEKFYDNIKDSIVFKDIKDEYITIKDYLEQAKEKHENKIYYVSDLEKQSQNIKLFKEYDLNALVLNTPIDNHFISFLEYKGEGLSFARIDSDVSEVLKDKEDNAENQEEVKKNNEVIEKIFMDNLGERVKAVKAESLKDKGTPAMLSVDENSRRMKEMQAMFAGSNDMNPFKEEKTLILNKNNNIVKKIINLSGDEDKKEQLEMLCNHILDIALIANNDLPSEDMDNFIKRSSKLMDTLF
ncbi:molecular chaperone HtpG [Hathewaya proteolytica DSM 3090]|uniref:Molecular chaperone HtpG n=1 Tax=Hathewaya proteolytica DSM 3090 TaxID=1121331 RepID=A0A1M6SK27_9CLOT|nr:molecular chaperone HtpG [Hathewaya proteolytica]SHK45017.1 molecular chaperone HtpG [Hathewaya proteolytica DSM 3090]